MNNNDERYQIRISIGLLDLEIQDLDKRITATLAHIGHAIDYLDKPYNLNKLQHLQANYYQEMQKRARYQSLRELVCHVEYLIQKTNNLIKQRDEHYNALG